jgi:putative transposase
MPEKKIRGRKRHLFVDSQGLLIAVKVHSAAIQDRDGAKLLLEPLVGTCPRMKLLWADSGYAGQLITWIKNLLGWDVEIIKRLSDTQVPQSEDEPPAEKPSRGFQIQPRRWVVERTFAWISRCRRLARDFEGLCQTSESLIQLAMSRLMLFRLSRSSG